jgi:hypothetical protein
MRWGVDIDFLSNGNLLVMFSGETSYNDDVGRSIGFAEVTKGGLILANTADYACGLCGQQGSRLEPIAMEITDNDAIFMVGNSWNIDGVLWTGFEMSFGDPDMFLGKYDWNAKAWRTIELFGSGREDVATGMFLSGDSIIITGTTRGNVSMGEFSSDGSPNIQGGFIWSRLIADADDDGVLDLNDQCPSTPYGENADEIGCSETQNAWDSDEDGDGISNALDVCPNTSPGESVNATGCAASQVDTDGDGIYDSNDDCPYTSTAEIVGWDNNTMLLSEYVNAHGCAIGDIVDLDSDGDGVRDSVDECSNSEQGIITDENGCEVIIGSGTESVDDEVSDFCGALACSVFLIGAVLLVIKRMNSPSTNTVNAAHAQWKGNRKPVKAQHNSPVRGKIDHEQIKRLVRQYSIDSDVLGKYVQSFPPAKEESLKNAIKHRRAENEREKLAAVSLKPIRPLTPLKIKPKSSSLASQGSPGSSAHIQPKFQSGINNKIDSMDTDLLKNDKSTKPSEKKSIITTDSSGITTIETGFSIVTLNKLTDEVTKVPKDTEQHEMFYQEIRNMKHLDSKGFDVGLIDYDDGSTPKIVTRYMGPSKLSEQYQTLSNKGKKNLIIALVNQVAIIHKCGMVHRDLKPDNILIDARPLDGNHQFDAIIDFGIAMKINRKQSEIYNTAGTKFFGHSSQKDTNFSASLGQDWFSLARIFALILRGTSIDSLNAEMLISQTGLVMGKEITALDFNEPVAESISELITIATHPNCEDITTIGRLANAGKELSKNIRFNNPW